MRYFVYFPHLGFIWVTTILVFQTNRKYHPSDKLQNESDYHSSIKLLEIIRRGVFVLCGTHVRYSGNILVIVFLSRNIEIDFTITVEVTS